MSTKKENIVLIAGFKPLLKEVYRMMSKRIGASRAALDSEANAETVATKIFGMRMYSTSRQSEN